MNNFSKFLFIKRWVTLAFGALIFATGCGEISRGATSAAVSLGWDPSSDADVAGYLVYYGTQSHNYSTAIDVGTNLTTSINGLLNGSNYFFSVKSYSSAQVFSAYSDEVSFKVPSSPFMTGQTVYTNGIEFLEFSDGNAFGYYVEVGYPWIYHMDMGYEYIFEMNDGVNGVVLFDLSSGSYWYTSPAAFPYMYDYNLGSWLYYYPDAVNPGRYTSNPRYFYDFNTAQVITK